MLDEMIGIPFAEVVDLPSALCDERFHEAPPVIRLLERQLLDAVFESIQVFVDERRKEEPAVLADMPSQQSQHGFGIAWIEVREYGKQPYQIEAGVSRQRVLAQQASSLLVVCFIARGPA